MSTTPPATLTPAQSRAQRGKSSAQSRAVTLDRRARRADKYGTVKRAR